MNPRREIYAEDDRDAAALRDDSPHVVIAADAKRPLVDWRELWAYREVLYALIRREIKVRYAQTAAGAAWVIVQPLLTAGVLTLLAERWLSVPNEGIPYTVFVLSGLIASTYFNHALTKSSVCLVSAGLISKAYFPRLLMVLAAVAGGLVDMAVAAPVLGILMVYRHVAPGWTIVLLPVCVLFLVMVAIGAGTWVAVLNLYFRDVSHALPFATQLMFFLTPVAYPMSIVPAGWRLLYCLNPLVAAIGGIRWSLFRTPFPLSLEELSVSIGAGLALLLSGLWYFRRKEPVLADVGES